MKKRLLSLTLCATLFLSLATTGASAIDSNSKLEAVRALGILTGDNTGNLNLYSNVTRAEFVTMMTAASSFRDTIGSSGGVSLFKDVKQDHWASEYIRLALEQGWMSGYVDGTFRPEQSITLEEACTALLRLLGYDSSQLAGSFPSAQLSKARAIGLLDGVSAVQGQAITRQDCVELFYNLLLAQTSSGTGYGTSLGFTVTNGEIDYATLISTDTKGPYVATGNSLALPFSTTSATVYVDGTLSSFSEVEPYDVYYYNTNLATVWVYTSRVTGTLTGLSPSAAAPTTVTVSGVSYSIESSSAAYKLSSQGQFTQGDLVTLLLGMNGGVVDVITPQESETIYYGVVVSSSKSASSGSTTTSSSTSVQTATQVACSDGTVRTFYHSGSAISSGQLVSVSVTQSGTTLTRLQTSYLSGSFSSDGSSFAGYPLASDIEILDTDSSGGYLRVYPSRLAGVKLAANDVRYYTLDANGAIDCLILNEATGDTYTYAYVTSAEKTSSEQSVSGSYQYLIDGTSYSLNTNKAFNISAGGALLVYEDGQIDSMRQLTSITITELTSLTATSGTKQYALAEDIQVLLRDTTTSERFYATTLDQINASDYTLKGWYDNFGASAGGRLRIIVATPN
ncbi:MAG: S-layer homology domain-containing protein [Lawsonibacter sp.]|jgi:hypothetical protein